MSFQRLIGMLVVTGVLALVTSPATASPPAAVQCGQTLTHSVKLKADLVDCPGDGLILGAAGITVDLNGHTIDGVRASGCDRPFRERLSGVRNDGGYDDVTVENGTVQQFDNGVSAGSDSAGMSDSHIHDLALRDDRFAGVSLGSGAGAAATARNRVEHNLVAGTPCGAGLDLNTGQANQFTDNRVDGADTGIGLCCGELTDANVAAGNRVSHTTDLGILVFASGAAKIVGNDLSDIGGDPAIALFADNSGSQVQRNTITRAHGAGIVVGACPECEGEAALTPTGIDVSRNALAQTADGIILVLTNHDVVSGNTVSGAGTFGDPQTSGIGIAVVDSSDNLVRRNLVTGNRGPGIGVGDPPEFNPAGPVQGNVLKGNFAARNGGDGILVNPIAHDTTLTRNVAHHNAADGIHVLSPSTLLRRNIANGNGALGIEAVAGVTDAGGNLAHGNGNPAQCTGVVCG
jgi:hypothetical protein